MNISEAWPNVPSPLTWSVVGSALEEILRGAFFSIGALGRSELGAPDQLEQRLLGIFWGHPALNLNMWRALADRMPGTSGDALEAQLFGGVRGSTTSRPVRRRYPVVIAKLPVAAIRSRRALCGMEAEVDAWWRRSIDEQADPRPHVVVLDEAVARLRRLLPNQIVATFGVQGLYEQVGTLATSAGLPGLERTLLTSGTGETVESRIVGDLWAVSRDQLSLDQFLSNHGYRGPADFELASRPWRFDDGPLRSLIETLRSMDEAASPIAVKRRRAEERASAEQELLQALSPPRRAVARLLLRFAHAYVPMRELARAMLTQISDVVRFRARAIGVELVAAGMLDDPDDVFFLCLDELRDPPSDAAALVAYRKARRAEYEQLRLPEQWEGEVEPERVLDRPPGDEERTDRAAVIEGLGVSPGVVEGLARVVLDAKSTEGLEPGEILVCPTTDPSWAPYFLVAGGLVIDVGGPISHGAIVARELGIPCVINARDATRKIRTGDLLRVDGGAGRVEFV